ncbi:MAG TPA: hypothetical protein VGM26_00095 [Rhizomicrobium sp.]|jgi:hypothetical protein
MRRVPVVATIRDAYTFALTHLGGIIGLIWVPTVLLTVMGFFSSQRFYNDYIEAIAADNAAALGPGLLVMLGYLVAMLLLQAMIHVAIVQLAMGSRNASVVAHFAFGAPEWRMFRAFVAFVGLVFVLLIPVFIVGNVALMASGAGGRVPQAAMAVLMAFVLYGVVVIAMPRFLMLLPAIAVAETAPVLRRAWTLSSGNFWRLLAVMIGIFGPVLVIFTVLEMALAGHASSPAGANAQVQMVAGVMRAREVLPLISGLGFLVSPLLVGLFVGASVSVWRALKEDTSTVVLEA